MTALYIVRNSAGQQVGTYFATSPKHAVRRFLEGQAAYSAVFRSQGIKPDTFTAEAREHT